MIKKLKSIIRPYYLPIKYHKKRRDFKRHLSKHKKEGLPLKIVIGSSGIYDEDWIPSEVYILNLLDERTWNRYFVSNAIDAMLAEHVWEHLTLEQGKIAAKTCYKYLKQGGYIRLAVPDGFHNDQKYIDYVKPNGSGAGADDHKVLFNYKSFTSVFNEIGFQTKLLEHFDEKGEFHSTEWNKNEGTINRSIRYDKRNKDGKPNYTSIIIDAIKI